MKKSRKFLAVLLAIAMCLSNAALLVAVSAEGSSPSAKVGDTFVLGTPGTDNVNGYYSFSVITRDLPEGDLDASATWLGFDRQASVSMQNAVDMVVKDGSYYNPAYVTESSSASEARQDYIAFSDNTLSTYQSPRDIKVISFTAPEAGEYDISFDIAGIYGLAVFTGYDDGELTLDTRFDAQATFKRTVTLAKGQTFNMGFTRVFGNYDDTGANGIQYPVHDDVECVVSNLKTIFACDGENMIIGREFTLGNPGSSVCGAFELGMVVRPEEGSALQAVLKSPVSVENVIPMDYYGSNIYAPSSEAASDRRQSIKMTSPDLFRVWSNCKYVPIFQFVAPVDGVYELTFDIRSNWMGGVMTSIGNNPLELRVTYNDTNTYAYTESVTLAKGEVLNVGFPRAYGNFSDADSPSWDTVDADITNFKVSYIALEKYDFFENFGSEDYITEGNLFTVGARQIFTDTGKVGNYIVFDNSATAADDVLCASYHGKMVPGYYNSIYVNQGKNLAANAVFVPESNTSIHAWYPSSSTETIVAFTAPECGVYSFAFVGSMLWSASEGSPSRYYVEANGKIVDGCDLTFVGKETADFSGTVTLGEGDSIYFVYDPTKPEGGSYSAGGDNGKIDKIEVYR